MIHAAAVTGAPRASQGAPGPGRRRQRSPLRFSIPAHLRTQAPALIPWHTEAGLYRSDLAGRLPHGLTIPRALALRDLDADQAAPGTGLGQLIAGEVQTGQRHPADLPALEAACLPAYLAGIRAEGGTAGPAQIRNVPQRGPPIP